MKDFAKDQAEYLDAARAIALRTGNSNPSNADIRLEMDLARKRNSAEFAQFASDLDKDSPLG